MKTKTVDEHSAGGVVCREKDGEYEFLLGKHSGYHAWVLAKGLIEKGENSIEAAEREVEEELGVKVEVVGSLPIKSIEYYFYADMARVVGEDAKGEESERRVIKYQEDGGKKVKVHKRVDFYLMKFESDLGDHGWEMTDREWLGYEKAMDRLKFESEREVLDVAYQNLVG